MGSAAASPNHSWESLNLSGLRRMKGISLEQIADTSKIRVYYLEAIESGTFEKLPGGIFTTSYLRQYARAIEVPEAEVLKSYYSCKPDA
jgi:cytoskeletal protein RodZ